MTIWCPISLVKQLNFMTSMIQTSLTQIKGEQTNIINSLRSFIFEKNETLIQWRNTSNILNKEEHKVDFATKRPILPPSAWQQIPSFQKQKIPKKSQKQKDPKNKALVDSISQKSSNFHKILMLVYDNHTFTIQKKYGSK